jgi:hypothetical protein
LVAVGAATPRVAEHGFEHRHENKSAQRNWNFCNIILQ